MASAAVLGALKVILGSDTSAFDKGLRDSQSGLAAWGKQLTSIAAGIGLERVVNELLYGLRKAVTAGIETADQFNKLSQSAGVTTEEFSRLQYAAELADVPTDALGKSMVKLSKAMVSAASDGAGEAGRAFAEMGVSVRNQDGTLRSSSAVISDVAEKFAWYKDGAEKTSLATTLFGKAGAAMIPLLNLGRDGLQEAGAEAEKFGLVLDKKTTAAAEAFNDNLKRMDKIKQGLVMTITAQMLPTMEHLSEAFLEAKSSSSLLTDGAGVVVNVLKGITSVGYATVGAIKSLGGELSALWQVVEGFTSMDRSKILAGFKAFSDADSATNDAAKSLDAAIEKLWKAADAEGPDWTRQLIDIKSMQKEVSLLGSEWGKTVAPIVNSGEATKNALIAFLDSQNKRIAGQQAEAETIGKSVGEQARLKVAYEANAIALAKGIVINDAIRNSIAITGDAAAMAAMRIAAAQTAQLVMSPAEKYAQDLAQLEQVYLQTSMTAETFAARQQQLAESVGATWQQVGSNVMGSFAQLAGAFGKNNKEMGVAAKAFGIAQAIINTQMAVTKALATLGPTPMGFAAAAAAVAQGVASVATIGSQKFQTGGSLTVRGSGGPDSVPVMVSPGEQIDVWRPDEGGADRRRGSGGAAQITVAMPIATTRDALATLIDGFNDMFADGYRLKIAPT